MRPTSNTQDDIYKCVYNIQLDWQIVDDLNALVDASLKPFFMCFVCDDDFYLFIFFLKQLRFVTR